MKHFFLFLLVMAIAVPLFAQTSEPVPATQPAASADTPQSSAIVFYRPKRFVGSGLTPSVYVNGEQVARLDNGRFFVLHLEPGKYKLSSSMKHDPLEIEIKAGKLEFMEMVILTGNWRGGGRLIPTGESDGREALKKLKPLDKKWVTSDKVTFAVPEEVRAQK